MPKPIPDVSVVIPTRNRRALVARALATALGQRGVDVEVTVVDEGSSDDTAAFVSALADPRVTLVRHEMPKGVSEARNVGLSRARAPWVAFLDDDDVWAPDKLALQLDAARTGASWSCGGAVLVDLGLEILASWKFPCAPAAIPLLSYNCVPGGGSGPIVRTDLARRVGGFDTRLAILADWEMWIRLFLESPPAYADRPIIGYSRHNGSMSHLDDGFSAELDWIEEKHAGACRERGTSVYRDRWLTWAAASQMRAGKRQEALRIYLHLIRRYHDGKSVARALLAAFFPSLLVGCWRRNLRRRIPAEWRAYAEEWLAPLKATPRFGERRPSAAA
jgi:glycosyltransferase involved in cell wall biosynthesis